VVEPPVTSTGNIDGLPGLHLGAVGTPSASAAAATAPAAAAAAAWADATAPDTVVAAVVAIRTSKFASRPAGLWKA